MQIKITYEYFLDKDKYLKYRFLNTDFVPLTFDLININAWINTKLIQCTR